MTLYLILAAIGGAGGMAAAVRYVPIVRRMITTTGRGGPGAPE